MGPEQALAWGLIEEIAEAGKAVEKAMGLARAALEMPPVIMTMTKQAVNATANAHLHATSFMDADISILVRDTNEAQQSRASFRKGKR